MIHARAQDVRRQQVRSELDSPEGAVDTGCQGPGQQRLAYAGDIFDQDVPLGQQGDDGEPDDFGLAEDHQADVLHQAIGQGEQLVEGR